MRTELIYLMLSEGCNLKCSYCYETKKKKENMSEQVLSDSISYIFNYYPEVTNIVLFGGEPTLNLSGVIKCFEEIRKDVNVTLVTNGVTVYQSMLKAIRYRPTSIVQVSIDGKYQSMQDRVGNNENLFRDILRNAEQYANILDRPSGNKMVFHITLTKKNMKYLYENIKFLLDLHLTHQVNITSDFNADWDEKDYFLYSSQMNLVMKYMGEYQKQYNIMPIISTVNPEVTASKMPNGCPAGTYNIIINSAGDIYPCSRMYSNFGDQFKMGSIYEKKRADHDFFEKLNLNTTKCGACKVSGCIRCISANLEKSGSLLDCNPNHCMISAINENIRNKFQQNYGGKR